MIHSGSRQIVIICALVLLTLTTIPAHSQGATIGTPATANGSINDAFSSIYDAEQKGADVSILTERLNAAILLVQRAQAENATDPSKAIADLQAATLVAQTVEQDTASASSNGSGALQLRLYESISTIVATIAVSTVIYVRADRAYRRLWLFLYRNHLVKQDDE